MKVVRIDDEETKLTKRQQQKVAILKLTDNGKYIEGVGIKDNEFFLLTEGDDDEEYLAFKQHRHLVGGVKTTQEELIRLVKLMCVEEKIAKAKEKLSGS
jgi:hypothetical protein